MNPYAGLGVPLPPFFKTLLGIKQIRIDRHEDKDEYARRIVEALRKYGITPDVEFTQAVGHGTELARRAVENGYDLVVAAGGDGTINEVINALAGSDTALGVIPLGTANVFAIQLNLPETIEEVCRIIGSGKTEFIDLGKVGGRYFSCMAGIGFDAYVVKTMSRGLKKIFGALSYVLATCSVLLKYRFRRILVRLDDGARIYRGYFVLVCNGKYYAGDRVLAKDADLSDGKLDVCIFHHNNLLGLFLYLMGIRNRDLLKYSRMEIYQCRKAEVLRSGRHPVHVDAEYLSSTPVTFDVCPKALKVVIP